VIYINGWLFGSCGDIKQEVASIMSTHANAKISFNENKIKFWRCNHGGVTQGKKYETTSDE